MKQLIIAFAVTALTCACSTMSPEMQTSGPGYKIMGISDDPTYGYTEVNPIKVGGAFERGPRNEHDYLYALRGPDGQKLRYTRLGSCCSFETPNGYNGRGLLDKYEVSCPGIGKPVILYLNMYDYEEPKAPVGFTYAQY